MRRHSDAPLARRGTAIRIAYLVVAHVARVGARSRPGTDGRVVLCYHGVRDEQRASFAGQIAQLAKSTHNGDQWAPRARCRVVLTFDDAFANLLRNALPVLKQNRVPATVFVVAGNVGAAPCWDIDDEHPDKHESLMNWAQLRNLASHPLIRIGSHTMTHRRLATLHETEIRDELVESRRILEDELSCTVEDLALPHGSYDDRVLAIAKEVGYQRVYTLDERVHYGNEENGVIGRFSVSPDTWLCELRLTCGGAYAWLYEWRRAVRRLRRFVKGGS